MDASRDSGDKTRRIAMKRKIDVDAPEMLESKVPRFGESIATEVVVANGVMEDYDDSDDYKADDDEDLLELKINTRDPEMDYDALFDMVDPVEAASNEFREKTEKDDNKTEEPDSAGTVSRCLVS